FPWRRAIVPAVLVLVLAFLALRGGSERNAGIERTNAPQRTALVTVAPTIAPTVAPTVAPTIAPSAAPTVAPTGPTTATEIEPNNNPATAQLITMGTHAASIAPVDDVDF